MKRILAIVALCGLSGVAFALNIPIPPSAPPATQPADNKLIVHEWGTFTGFAGSDGVHLPFGIGIGSELPPFVINRRVHAERLNVKLNEWGDFTKGNGIFALQRMETPVVYFYTAKPRNVTVAVDFPQGQLSEFYPPVRSMSPAFGDGPDEYRFIERPPLPAGVKPTTRPEPKFEGGSLDWGTILLIPQIAGERPTYMPEVPKTPEAAAHYQHARETDAATVQFSDRPGERHDERFLFYRGLGDFKLPVTLTAADSDQFELNNSGEQPIAFALLLRIADRRARFALHSNVTGRRSMTLPAETVSLDQVGDEIRHALVAEGLFEKEARAMVKTWSSNWLGEPGTRVLYTVPRAVTDGLLPLRINPAPDETVRVLVGRIDVITPQDEAKIQSLLATARQTKALAAADATFLRNLGRFFNPALDRAAKLRGSPSAKAESNTLRSLYWSAPKPEQQASASATPD
ncbi:MAG: hypothetical protein QOF78_1232 [Phycisphaerales bacterium]|nr:hypothetical protein [Phycisphaerales bacterium]